MASAGDFHLHLVSDATGETLHALARAALAPFRPETEVRLHLTVFVRTARDLEVALAELRAQPGPVWYTVVDPAMRRLIDAACRELGVSHNSVLTPLIDDLARHFGRPPRHRPGLQHQMGSDYFERIAALDFAIAHDDGALAERLRRADVVLTGVSRTSKTPTCIYLAYRGVKAANVPLVPNREPPPELMAALAAGTPVIGLTASPSRLAQVRSHRLDSLGHAPGADYADLERIRREVAEARLFFQRHRIPVIDVTRRSIEETAAEILAELRSRGTPAAARDAARRDLPDSIR
ncbi:MAG TPA: pyruvate, water dikinase regulatory protein [Thermohalobaculum sp.]|nr:pyruvate, water dikinase regulatory protein [Thermohalobaculum sp.]